MVNRLYQFMLGGAVLAVSLAMTAGVQAGDRVFGADFASRSPVIAANGMAATSHPLASQIAVDILQQGGNAVDAAIAANAALGLMEPTGNGIGGDLFAIVWDPETQKLYGLNASGRAPLGQTLDDLRQKLGDRQSIPLWGSLSVSVPGAVDGWFELHGQFGSMEMAEILAPAIRYAEEGFPLTQTIAGYWAANLERFNNEQDVIEEFDNAKKLYFPGGEAPKEGEIFKNADLAKTLRLIGQKGRDVFYKGEIAKTVDAYMKRIGGPLRAEDFAKHESEWVDPVSVNYRGYDVYELPPNGQGIAALQMLNLIEPFDLASMGRQSADFWHIMIEAKKIAYADRARFYADPAFYDVPLEGLLSKDYAAKRRALLDMENALQEIPHGDPRMADGDTIYMTVADDSGMMVSLIQSNFAGMGSGLVPDGLGFMLQDRGALFTLEDDHPNVYEPGKRPFHTIIPAFVMKDGKPWLSFGVMGGAMQPQGHVQILVNMIDFGMNVQEAGDTARVRHTGSSQPTGEVMNDGGVVHVESGVPTEVIEELRARGHSVKVEAGLYGGYQAILRDEENGVYHGATEMRKDGHAAGY